MRRKEAEEYRRKIERAAEAQTDEAAVESIELFVGYIIAPLIWHFTYGRGKE